jgi:hypothetical protein
MTSIPPNPIILSISPVLPRDLFSILPGRDSLTMEVRSAGNRLIIGATIEDVLRKSRLFILFHFVPGQKLTFCLLFAKICDINNGRILTDVFKR